MIINKLEPLEDQEVRDEGSSSGENKFEFSLGSAKANKKKQKKRGTKKKMNPDGYTK